jgi:sugar lactone lactonase YvrE
MSSIRPTVRSTFDRICPSNVWLLFGFLVTVVPPAPAQSSTSNVFQAILASADNNGLSSPEAVAVRSDGNVFIADTGNNRVVEEPWNRANKTYGTQITVITNLVNPSSVVVGTSGNVYIADSGNNRVVELPWNPSTSSYGPETTVGSGLANPRNVALAANGSVYIADTGNNRVVEVPWDHTSGTYGPQTTVGVDLFSPECITIGEGGKLYIANSGNSTVVEIPAGCNALTVCTTQTTVANETNGLAAPNDLVVAADAKLYITQPATNQVIALQWNRSIGAYGTQTTVGADLNGPKGVAVDATGNLYIADTLNNRVLKIAQQQSGNRRSGGRMSGSRMPL